MTRVSSTAPRLAPVAVGGVGGSGTRVIAEALFGLGFYLGRDLNDESDNLWFTLLFKRVDVLDLTDAEFEELAGLFLNAMRPVRQLSADEQKLLWNLAREDRLQHPASWLQQRAQSLISEVEVRQETSTRWGWKEPNTHFVIERWLRFNSDLRYVHVVRNGLDMAYSSNQNQPSFWGARILGSISEPPTPRDSLSFWCVTHRRILELERAHPDRVLLLNFDRLCHTPTEESRSLLEFVGIEPDLEVLTRLSRGVRPPETVGRFKDQDLSSFDPADIEFVRSLGFDTVPG